MDCSKGTIFREVEERSITVMEIWSGWMKERSWGMWGEENRSGEYVRDEWE